MTSLSELAGTVPALEIELHRLLVFAQAQTVLRGLVEAPAPERK